MMKACFGLLLVILLVMLPAIANAGLDVSHWWEDSLMTDDGKKTEITIYAKVSDLDRGRVMSSFMIGFDKRQQINITSVMLDSKPAEYSFVDNVLKIKFLNAQGKGGKVNGNSAVIKLSYVEKYEKINRFLRQEIIYVPSFAAGANARVTFTFPGSFESATLNPNVTKMGNSFVYNNLVSKEGVKEVIKLTPAQSVWDVTARVKINSDKALGKLAVSLPSYFKISDQKVENLVALADVMPVKQTWSKTIEGGQVMDFELQKNQLTIETRARISTGKMNRSMIVRNVNDYLAVDPNDLALLLPIVERIKQNWKYNNLPLYAKIGRFVNEFIRYDASYLGKLPPLREVLQNPVGVCTEYANLFNLLARVAKIPSMVIEGSSCGEYQKCQGHAWNLIFYNNQWIQVDPTWDLMSGVVSSSHVYFYDSDKSSVGVTYVSDGRKVSTQLDSEMKNVY